VVPYDDAGGSAVRFTWHLAGFTGWRPFAGSHQAQGREAATAGWRGGPAAGMGHQSDANAYMPKLERVKVGRCCSSAG